MSKLIFITGGVRSGKSAFAEQQAIKLYKENEKAIYYLATGVAFDDEMKNRIYHHQKQRDDSQINWQTIEFESDIPLINISEGDVILWDCVTTWINNVLYITENEMNRHEEIENYIEKFKNIIQSWKDKGAIVVLVSNEVLDEGESSFLEVNLYRKLLGKLHQWIVKISDEAYEMDYSLIQRKK